MILTARRAVEIGGVAAEMRLQKIERTLAQESAPVTMLSFSIRCRRYRPDTMEAPDRQAGDEIGPARRRDHAQAIGLVLVRGELCDELVVGDTGRGGQADLRPDPRAISSAMARADPRPR